MRVVRWNHSGDTDQSDPALRARAVPRRRCPTRRPAACAPASARTIRTAAAIARSSSPSTRPRAALVLRQQLGERLRPRQGRRRRRRQLRLAARQPRRGDEGRGPDAGRRVDRHRRRAGREDGRAGDPSEGLHAEPLGRPVQSVLARHALSVQGRRAAQPISRRRRSRCIAAEAVLRQVHADQATASQRDDEPRASRAQLGFADEQRFSQSMLDAVDAGGFDRASATTAAKASRRRARGRRRSLASIGPRSSRGAEAAPCDDWLHDVRLRRRARRRRRRPPPPRRRRSLLAAARRRARQPAHPRRRPDADADARVPADRAAARDGPVLAVPDRGGLGLRRARPGLVLEQLLLRRAHRHALRRADPLDLGHATCRTTRSTRSRRSTSSRRPA